MTVIGAHEPRAASVHNQQTFDTCIATTLRLLATIEFAPVVGDEPLTPDLLDAYATEIERHAQDLAALAGFPHTDVIGYGRDWYQEVSRARRAPLQAAYHAIHSAAWLGLEQGATTAGMLAGVAAAVRDLAGQHGRLTN
ncbi:hypothetical protein [Deinococcus soli (ex Cha et al. 2016)]|uniref:Uncharacterized protein n=2 Tax=Deinococcus soli (ex Cha et al. 2016) TaxID=1309411 RepID=A0AAE3XJF8_9DEIO|nr:hypothetical protein [Deinococcus soli (ex Cha et al. 2016)]MDR6221410.1 hypothetical protein [Deinococcus soli (ex Cha et al. 2016)]MDR6331421.1 hypothetical protein [Deinococcus soli (ex Cha et al. 2016)]MDR6754559.1 hypothetical protein [Deinococcus soli (ex Cha et al. 2016)]